MQPIPTPVPIASSYHSVNRNEYSSQPQPITSFPRQQSWAKEFGGEVSSAGWAGSMGMSMSPLTGENLGLGVGDKMVYDPSGGHPSSAELDHGSLAGNLWAPSGSWRGEGWQGLAVPPSSPNNLNIPLSSSLTFLSPLQTGSYLPSSPAQSRMGELSMSIDSLSSSLPHRSRSDVGSLAANRGSFSTGHSAYVTGSLGGNRMGGGGGGTGLFGGGFGGSQFNGPSSVERLSKLEQNFTSNFTCCGLQLKGLHDLLEHYEESHVLIGNNGYHPSTGMPPFQKPSMLSRTNTASGGLAHSSSTPPLMQSFSAPGHPTTPSPTTDSDSPHTPGMMDLEMEDTITLPSPFPCPPRSASVSVPTGISSFPSPWSSASALSSHPATPVPQCVPPSLLTYALPSRSNSTPITSAVTSPASSLGSLGSLPGSLSSSGLLVGGGRSDKRRTASVSAVKEKPEPAESDGRGTHVSGFQTDKDKSANTNTPVISESSVVMDLSVSAGGGEKRFRCPVEGCGKVYKQQNGLKYHLQRSINSNHGHYKGSITSVGAVVLTPASEYVAPTPPTTAPAPSSSSPSSPFSTSGTSWAGRSNGLSA